MNNRPNRPIDIELRELRSALATLTLRVEEIEARAEEEPIAERRVPLLGDRVQFTVAGRYTEGVIVGITRRRVHIRQDHTRSIILRAPHNVTIIL
jgi:hypothetical protein